MIRNIFFKQLEEKKQWIKNYVFVEKYSYFNIKIIKPDRNKINVYME